MIIIILGQSYSISFTQIKPVQCAAAGAEAGG